MVLLNIFTPNMKLREILAISGQQGLFKFVSKGRTGTGFIVESLTDGRRSAVPLSAKVNSLADTSIVTLSQDIPLHEVLAAIKDKHNGAPALNAKTASDEELTEFFADIVPNYDRSKVHLSDIKKIAAWYNILQQHALLDFEIDEEDANAADAKISAHTTSHKTMHSNVPKTSTKAAGAAQILAPRKAQ
jgi:hypothetical protein